MAKFNIALWVPAEDPKNYKKTAADDRAGENFKNIWQMN